MRLEIRVLSPVHVGTGEVLGGLEYALEGDFRVADLGRLFRRDPARAEAIGQKLGAIAPDQLHAMSLADILTPQEISDDTLCRYRLGLSPGTRAALAAAKGKIHEIRPACKRADGFAFLPGSSIKGALRTALVFAGAKADASWARGFLNLRAGEADRIVQAILFGARTDPNHDILRALMIGDSKGVDVDAGLRLVQERVLSAGISADGSRMRGVSRDTYKAFLVFLEAIPQGVSFAAPVRLLDFLLEPRVAQVLGWKETQRALGFQVLCDAANAMAREVCAWELEYFDRVAGLDVSAIKQFYRSLQAKLAAPPANVGYLSVGRGAGWHKLTVGMRMTKALDPQEFAMFRQQHALASSGRFDRLAFAFPKSRKLVTEGERAVSPLGWVRLTFGEAGAIVQPEEPAPAPVPVEQVPEPKPTPASPPPVGPASGADLERLRERFSKQTSRRPESPEAPKASEKAKREQEKYRRKLRGEEP